MKGVILGIFPEARLVDLSHEIEPQNVLQAAFVLEAAYPYFPRSSIFVNVVDPGVGSERRILAAKTHSGIFLAPDNGLLSGVLAKTEKYEMRSVTNRRFFAKKISQTFHGRDCFAPASAQLAKNESLFNDLGPVVSDYKKLIRPSPRIERGKMKGEVLFFDHFGNAFTNIETRHLKKNLSTNCQVWVGRRNLGPIRNSYFEGQKGDAMALMSSSDILEIAVNQGSARSVLHLKKGTPIEVYFEK
jgi:S-adenosylmethionine hydrolase